jgi:hypothetical protein
MLGPIDGLSFKENTMAIIPLIIEDHFIDQHAITKFFRMFYRMTMNDIKILSALELLQIYAVADLYDVDFIKDTCIDTLIEYHINKSGICHVVELCENIHGFNETNMRSMHRINPKVHLLTKRCVQWLKAYLFTERLMYDIVKVMSNKLLDIILKYDDVVMFPGSKSDLLNAWNIYNRAIEDGIVYTPPFNFVQYKSDAWDNNPNEKRINICYDITDLSSPRTYDCDDNVSSVFRPGFKDDNTRLLCKFDHRKTEFRIVAMKEKDNSDVWGIYIVRHFNGNNNSSPFPCGEDVTVESWMMDSYNTKYAPVFLSKEENYRKCLLVVASDTQSTAFLLPQNNTSRPEK